jgi:hypothetical protein
MGGRRGTGGDVDYINQYADDLANIVSSIRQKSQMENHYCYLVEDLLIYIEIRNSPAVILINYRLNDYSLIVPFV